jgi:penicillin-binding protein 2
MAVAYSAIANGGHIVTPHLGLRVEDKQGAILQRIQPGSRRKLDISETTKSTLMDALRSVVQGDGTAAKAFSGFPVATAGKTGTAVTGRGDQAWYCGMAPAKVPEIVACTTIERGGYGADTAAPATRQILAAHLNVKGKKATAPDPETEIDQ